MEELRAYLATLTPDEQAEYARRSNTTIGYLRKVLSTGGRIGESIVIALERESGRKVTCEGMRPDVDWAYLRGTKARKESNSAGRAA